MANSLFATVARVLSKAIFTVSANSEIGDPINKPGNIAIAGF
ncbi:MAG: hypothetical protein PHH43_07960 [Candidatus Cloacimonetes bacterium]|nr:hypothetical protein [Candidatus Cloacimonadota bacterium]